MTEATQMQVYVRRWRPSTWLVDHKHDIILDQNTPEHLRMKLAEISGIPQEDIQYAKVGVACCSPEVGVVLLHWFNVELTRGYSTQCVRWFIFCHAVQKTRKIKLERFGS